MKTKPMKVKGKRKMQQAVAQSYEKFLTGIKEKILIAQVKAALAANTEFIGSDILETGKGVFQRWIKRQWE